jgi:hypothetical protein
MDGWAGVEGPGGGEILMPCTMFQEVSFVCISMGKEFVVFHAAKRKVPTYVPLFAMASCLVVIFPKHNCNHRL